VDHSALVRAIRILLRFGTFLIVGSVVVMIVAPSARPAPSAFVIPIAAALGAGVVTGVILRSSLPLRLRLRLLRSLSPRLAHRFFGDFANPPDGEDATNRR
jgi:hypothetical protein